MATNETVPRGEWVQCAVLVTIPTVQQTTIAPCVPRDTIVPPQAKNIGVLQLITVLQAAQIWLTLNALHGMTAPTIKCALMGNILPLIK